MEMGDGESEERKNLRNCKMTREKEDERRPVEKKIRKRREEE